MAWLDVSAVYKEEQGKIILENISFQQNASQHTAVAGESGAGKTTLLKIIAGLTQPDKGQVLFNSKRVEGPLEKLIPGHPQIAYLSQHFELRNNYRVEEILQYANQLSQHEATRLYEVCRIDQLLKRWTHQLSGGEKQRIALARLLTTSPQLLLLDEPYSNLDPIHKNILKSVVEDLGEKLKITCLLTSHDPGDTLSWADEIIVMKSGRIIQQATPQNIYRYPVDEYVAGLFGKFNAVDQNMRNVFPNIGSEKEFLRPEDFYFADPHEGTNMGTVIQSSFMGSHYEIEVSIRGNRTITVRHSGNTIKKGQEVFVSLHN